MVPGREVAVIKEFSCSVAVKLGDPVVEQLTLLNVATPLEAS
jgi:hypothetical protein